MDAFLVIIAIVFAIILFIIDIYVLILYCHPDDKDWGSSAFCKILVVILIF